MMLAVLQHCEEGFLEVAIAHGLCKPPAQSMTLADILRAHLEDPQVKPVLHSGTYSAKL